MTLIVLLSEAHPYCTQHGRAIVTHTEDKENDTLAGRSKFGKVREKIDVSSGRTRWAHVVSFGLGVLMQCEPLCAQVDQSAVRRRALTEKGLKQVRRGDGGCKCCRYATSLDVRVAEDVLCLALAGFVRTYVGAGDLSCLKQELCGCGQKQYARAGHVVGELETYFRQDVHAADKLGEEV